MKLKTRLVEMVKCSLSESWSKYCSLYMKTAVGSNRKLNSDEKAVQQALFNEIIAFWPNPDFDKEKAMGRWYSLTDACSFWFKSLRPMFNVMISRWMNDTVAMVCWPIDIKCSK